MIIKIRRGIRRGVRHGIRHELRHEIRHGMRREIRYEIRCEVKCDDINTNSLRLCNSSFILFKITAWLLLSIIYG